MIRLLCLAVIVWGSVVGPSWAWNRAGHELVARIAWNRLDETARARLYEVLRHHPAFAAWEQEALAVAPAERRVFVVQRAAVWPDDIKHAPEGSPYRVDASQVHRNWHYIDTPLSFDGTAVPETPTPNVVTALQDCEAGLLGRALSPEQRAIAVAWLLHLVGDIHQPLHCAERFSRELPKGDRGGNEWWVCTPVGKSPVKLHAMWDAMALRRTSLVSRTADELAREGMSVDVGGSWASWVAEGTLLAREQVYEEGRVPGAPVVEASAPPADVPRLSKTYLARGHRLARERVWRAGCRLADRLSRYLASRP